jgi:hypothetical protein
MYFVFFKIQTTEKCHRSWLDMKAKKSTHKIIKMLTLFLLPAM